VTDPEYADIMLTSIMKNYDISVVQAVRATVDGTFSGREHVGTLETDEVSLAPFYKFDSLISAKVRMDLEQIKKEIIAGTINTNP
jgi:basic membrane protein A and related proteins